MASPLRLLRRAALVHVAGLALLVAPGSAASIPLPEDDPFYAVPKKRKLAPLANGEVLKSREVEVSSLGLPLAVTAWQVKYKTIDVHGKPSAYVTTVMIPDSPWTGGGPRPLLSYQTAQDGISTKCAPSYALRTGFEAGNSGAETIAMAIALARGWALTAPDYEGPRSEFLGAKGEARGVIDGVRAALRFDTAGFRAGTPVGLIGYSGGALASTLGAQLQPRYAPKLKLAGVALGGVPADIGATMRAFSGTAFGGAVAMGIAAADRSYPAANVEQYLNQAGLAAMEASQHDCISDAVARHPFASIEDYARDPAVFGSPPVVALLQRMSPLWFRGTPSAPVYEYHAVLDELAPIGPARALVDRFCAAGTPVQQVEDYIGEHITELITGYLGAMDYLQNRFDGKPPPSNC